MGKLIADKFQAWKDACNARFDQLKKNEETLHRIFIDIYGLQDELTPEVEEKAVTVKKADLTREIKSLISYAVGCMFGRYTLDKEGLCYAGGDIEEQFVLVDFPKKSPSYPLKPRYYLKEIANFGDLSSHFGAEADNIIPITDEAYFSEDIVTRFIEFIRIAYGEDTLRDNLKFIADGLGGKGTAQEIIRNYFVNDFYADHLKTYQKRPIYWLFSSGKNHSFQCLIYIHRYHPHIVANICSQYIHPLQTCYSNAITKLESSLSENSDCDTLQLKKQLKKRQTQASELQKYEAKLKAYAQQKIVLDLDDGIKVNYGKFDDILAPVK